MPWEIQPCYFEVKQIEVITDIPAQEIPVLSAVA
jgi:hypothetical protein